MTYQFKVGDTGKTRDGRRYRVLATDLKSVETIVAAITPPNGEEFVVERLATGKVHLDGSRAVGDLMPPTQVVYINVYERQDGTRCAYNHPSWSREEADLAITRVHTRIGCIRVDLEARFDD
jgi:hypothetical protein